MLSRRRPDVAGALLCYALLCAAGAAATAVLSGRSWDGLVDTMVVSNTLNGLALTAAGWPIAHARPRNAVGWLLLTGGCGFLTSAATMGLLLTARGAGWEGWWTSLVGTAANLGFPWPICFGLPAALLLFPGGHLPGPRWRVGLVVCGLGVLGFTTASLAHPRGSLGGEDLVPDLGSGPAAAASTVGNGATLVAYLLGLAALTVRYGRGGETVRRQILWVLLAVVLFVVAAALSPVVGDSLVLGLLPIMLIPLSMTVAVLRHNLLDIRLVVARSLLYLVLSGGVVAAYSSLVVMIDWSLRRQVTGAPVIAALAIAFAFHPVRVAVQQRCDRLLYGARRDPVRALADVGARLGSSTLPGVLEALSRSLRLPAAAIVAGGRVLADHGVLPPDTEVVPLRHGDRRVGDLVVGLRSGQSRATAPDQQVLGLLAAPLAAAVHGELLAAELADSRQRVISGREEERLRLRRDLHDGLGPSLTGVVLHADAALELIRRDPDQAVTLIGRLRDQTAAAIEDIRRLVYDLRPPTLDHRGLEGALRDQASGMRTRRDGSPLRVTVTADLPAQLPAAVEVATYRIVTEALTNVVRHSRASRADVRVRRVADALDIEVVDDGSAPGPWVPGVGITSIRERAAELRGGVEIRLDGHGGAVRVQIPLAEAP